MSIDQKAFNIAVDATAGEVPPESGITYDALQRLCIAYHEAAKSAEQPLKKILAAAGGSITILSDEQPVAITALQTIAKAAVSSSPDAHYLGNVARQALGMEPLPKKEKMP